MRQYYGIYVMALWSVILAGQCLTRLPLARLAENSNVAELFGPLLLYQWLNALFALGFLVAAIGLFRRRNWGRIFFQAVAVLFFVTALVSLFFVEPASNTWFIVLRYLISILIPLVYLNLPFVRAKFRPDTP